MSKPDCTCPTCTGREPSVVEVAAHNANAVTYSCATGTAALGPTCIQLFLNGLAYGLACNVRGGAPVIAEAFEFAAKMIRENPSPEFNTDPAPSTKAH